MNLGQLVRDHRIKMKMTQLELATRLGYESVQFVSLFERGLSKVPKEVLGKMIIILKLPEKMIIKNLVQDFENKIRAEIEAGKRSQQ